MLNPLIIGQPEDFCSLISSVTTEPSFINDIFKSFLITLSILLMVTTAVRAIGRIMVLRIAGRLAQRDEPI